MLSHRLWDTGFVDLAGDQGLLGQCEGRTAATVVATLREHTHRFATVSPHVAIDPPSSFATAARPALPANPR